MSNSQTSVHQLIGLPLAVAIASLMMTACSTTPVSNTTNSQGTLISTRTPTLIKTPASSIYNNVYTNSTKLTRIQTNNPALNKSINNAINNINTQTPTLPTATNPMPTTLSSDVALLDAESLNELAELLEATDMSMVENDQRTINRMGNLWDRVRKNYGISRINSYNPRIEAQKSWFITRQDYLNRLTARASRYLYHTVKEAEQRGLPTELALLPIIESSYDPLVSSQSGAKGLWQFMPATGKAYGLEQSSYFDGRQDVIESTSAAYEYLGNLYNQFGSWELALAAYNAGPSRVQNAINKNRQKGINSDFWSLDLPVETKNYVPRFLAVSEIVANPSAYGVSLPAIANNQHFTTVSANLGVSLDQVAMATGVPYKELQLLNPGLLMGRVESNTPPRLVVPNYLNPNQLTQIKKLSGNPTQSTSHYNPYQPKPFIPDSSSSELAKYAQNASTMNTGSRLPLPSSTYRQPRGTRSSYVVQPGDTLTSIAARARVSLAQIAQWNQINPNAALIAGTSLYLYDVDYMMPATNSSQKSTPSQKPTSYRVQSGDTLIGTAYRFGLSPTQLASYNNLDTNAMLKSGQKLWLIPGKVNKVKSRTTTSNTTKSYSKPYSGVVSRYRIRSGDTLNGIARKLGTTPTTIAQLNNVSDQYLVQKDQYIRVPASKQTVDLRLNNQSVKYKVQNGDTLTGVANRFGVGVRALATTNNLQTNSQLLRYSTITIPSMANVASNQTMTKPGRGSHRVRQTQSYRVQNGDSLTGLAKRYESSVPELSKLNNFSTTSDLLIGQIIKVPKISIPYTVRSGDSLTGLAARYGVSAQQFANMNNLSVDSMLQIGQVIQVPNH